MVYAVVDIGGNQIIVEPGKFYDVNYICAEPGDLINLNRVLFFSDSNNQFSLGNPCLSAVVIKAKILRHVKGKKITVFKMKSKKNYRIKQGHRQKRTRLLVEDIIS
uniref:Large ribosomal subunit protein bL21c n=1 Tax=Lophocladia kuetzingii TaxID=675577 RepID=A0A1Z1MP90_9FLOR|nr:ribosomal protein L21 [Lophocladia kuetzingii]ARW67564.1 ribosomal protein L21 [Lophocladia kuetzingii]